MEGQIDEKGNLRLLRKGKLKIQSCPYSDIDPCGDWCPRFIDDLASDKIDGISRLTICGDVMEFSHLKDLRFDYSKGE